MHLLFYLPNDLAVRGIIPLQFSVSLMLQKPLYPNPAGNNFQGPSKPLASPFNFFHREPGLEGNRLNIELVEARVIAGIDEEQEDQLICRRQLPKP
ncbi:MAG: hypothetical protein ABJB49_10575, partial [Nitrospirota bacterium]